MKYKNIELIESKDSEAELLCTVDLLNDSEDEEIMEKFEYILYDLFEDFEHKVEIEAVTDDSIQVRCGTITFDKKGVDLLKRIYDKLVGARLNAEITVGVHSDTEWFKAEDGHEYNQDDVTFEEFLKHIEY